MIATTRTLVEDVISDALARIRDGRGPEKVLVNMHGEAHAPARVPGGWTRCACVLVRNDGWTLGCPRSLYEAGRQLWLRDWVAVICYANTPHHVVIKLAR